MVAASARRSDPLGQSAKSLELREITHNIGSLLFSSQRAQRKGPSRTRRHGPSVDAGPDGRSAVHAAESRDRSRRAHRLGRRSRGIGLATPALRDGARALRGGIRDGATPDALRPHAGGAERRYARDARGSQHSAPPDGRRRRPAAIRGSRRAPRGRFRRHLHHRGHRHGRAAPGPRVRRSLPNRRRPSPRPRYRRCASSPTSRTASASWLRLRARARRVRLRARVARHPIDDTAGERRHRRVASKPPPPPALVESVTKLDDDGGGGGATNAYAVTTCEATPHGLVVGDRVELVAKERVKNKKNDKLAAPGPTATVSASTGTHSFTATLRLPNDAFSPGDCEYVRWVGAEAASSSRRRFIRRFVSGRIARVGSPKVERRKLERTPVARHPAVLRRRRRGARAGASPARSRRVGARGRSVRLGR